MSKSTAAEAADLRREMDELANDPVAEKVAQAVGTASDTVIACAQDLAAAVRRQPFAALAIGMAAAYALGRLVSSSARR